MSAQIFGLDIGRSFIKITKANVSGGKKILEAAANVPSIPGGIMTESSVDLKKLSENIESCVKLAKLKVKSCNVSMIESQVITRLIELPNLTDKELSAAIEWEAEQYIPLPIKDVNLQYKVVSKPSTGMSQDKMKVLLVAAPKRVITKYIDVVKHAGLTVSSLESESFALARALAKPTDPATVIVSLGAESTELVVIEAQTVFFTRSIATGGINLTKAIRSEFALPQDQAEKYKQTYGILEDKLSGKVANVLKPILDVLVSEILKAMEFAHLHVKNAQISRIIICGGGAFLPGLAHYITERTSLEVSFGDAWGDFVKEGLITKLSGQGSVYTVATGLALRT